MADRKCGPHFSGAACDWPICVHGVVDPATRVCLCHNNFAPPFCELCLPGFWAEECDREIIPPMKEPILPAFFSHVVVYLLIVVLMLLIYFACAWRRSRPPPYEDVAPESPPPPYYLI